MKNFNVPTREDVTIENQEVFDKLKKQIGFVPNLYATMALSPNALESYLNFSGRKLSLSKKEKEVVNLAVSQVNGCQYCQSAHTALGKMNGFAESEILEFRKGNSSTSAKFDILAKASRELMENKGHISEDTRSKFFELGYTPENLVDVIFLTGDKVITNFMYASFGYPIDFPVAEEILETA